MRYEVELTDTFAGEPNYAWVRRASIVMPELTHYGYDGGTNYVRANRIYRRELIRRAKSALGISGRHRTDEYGDTVELRPCGSATVVFIHPTWEPVQ